MRRDARTSKGSLRATTTPRSPSRMRSSDCGTIGTAGAPRVKKMILELGGFYLKVGQVFATKSDLLPPQYVAALKSVFDDCPPVSAKKIDAS